jgi:hypothetical protein
VTALAEPKPEKEKGLLGYPVPTDIRDRVKRGREAAKKEQGLRRLCHKMWAGDQYWYQNAQGSLRFLSTALVDVSGGKPSHRIRNTYNFIQSIVEGKVSAATQRVPGYEVDPSSADNTLRQAARISEQVAFYGYDKWYLRRVGTKVATLALVQREGFAVPFYDKNIGPFKGGEAQGEIRVLTLSRSEVLWEPGVDFLESRWHVIERAVLVEDIKAIPGYVGGELRKDASTADLPSEKTSDEMAILSEYLERPCPEYPEGRRCFIASDRVVVDYRKDPEAPEDADWWEGFPYVDADGVVCDEPSIHRLSYTVNPEGDDMGLVERLVDLMRTVNDCWNKLLEWKNRTLMPRFSAPRGAEFRTNDVPGGVDYYRPQGLLKPEQERPIPVPRELFDMLNMAVEQMRALAADINAQPEPDLAAKTLNAAVEQATLRWQSFLGDYAEFQSRLMRHCLCLVARFYTDERLIPVRGRYGSEPILAFRGQDLRSQVNVRVLPGSIETKSRAQVMREIEFIQQNWPGALSPEAALAALHGGNAESLLRSYQLDVDRAWKLVQTLRQGPDAMLSFPERVDLDLGDPAMGYRVPGWMPRVQDNIAIWKTVVADYTKTDDFDRQRPETQHMFDVVYRGLEFLEQRRQMQVAMQSQSAAMELGQANAARPQGNIPMPNQGGGLSPEQAAPAALSPG